MNLKGSGVELDLTHVACAMCGSAETEPRPVFGLFRHKCWIPAFC